MTANPDVPTKPPEQVRVAVVGATGLAGQEFIAALSGHPQFRITHLAASARSAGKRYQDALRQPSGALSWYGQGPLDPQIGDLVVEDAARLDASAVDLVFSCVDSEPARALEPVYAATTPVISTASAFRMEKDVPLLIPGVNMDHAPLLAEQRARGWKGFIAPNPNCTTVGLAITLAPLHQAFGVRHVHMVSLQAISGAGRSPGVIGLDILDNVVPFIPKEEEKVAIETQKVLGTLSGATVTPARFPISATCTRVPVIEGHTEAVHVQLERQASESDLRAAWRSFGSDFLAMGHRSAPPVLIHQHEDPFRPQVRLDRDLGDGMTTSVGRLRQDPTVEHGWKYVLVSHNTKMGASKGCLLLAEHLLSIGMIAAR